MSARDEASLSTEDLRFYMTYRAKSRYPLDLLLVVHLRTRRSVDIRDGPPGDQLKALSYWVNPPAPQRRAREIRTHASADVSLLPLD